jgi:hypothetical protein
MTLTDLLSDYVDRPQLATELKVSERTVRRYELEPDGLPFVRMGRRKLYNIPRARDWIQRREHKPNPRRGR